MCFVKHPWICQKHFMNHEFWTMLPRFKQVHVLYNSCVFLVVSGVSDVICYNSKSDLEKYNLCLPLSPTDGCPGLCNGNGQCIMGQNSWHCECHTGWRGTGCSVAMEISCNDNKDNEGGENQFQPTIKTEPGETLKSYSKTRSCGGIRWGFIAYAFSHEIDP